MMKLIKQFIKFGMVGAFCFVVDFSVTMGLKIVGVHYLLAGFCGFVVSVLFNYFLSFKFVFKRKEDLDRRKEFIIFVFLSAIGCGINELVLYVCMEYIYGNWTWLRSLAGENIATAGSKIVATGVVTIYNFVTRKLFLENKEPKDVKSENNESEEING